MDTGNLDGIDWELTGEFDIVAGAVAVGPNCLRKTAVCRLVNWSATRGGSARAAKAGGVYVKEDDDAAGSVETDESRTY